MSLARDLFKVNKTSAKLLQLYHDLDNPHAQWRFFREAHSIINTLNDVIRKVNAEEHE